MMHVIEAHRHAVRNRTMFALSFYAGLRACEIGGWLILNQRDKPEDIPTAPWQVYKNKEWIDLKDWLGTN